MLEANLRAPCVPVSADRSPREVTRQDAPLLNEAECRVVTRQVSTLLTQTRRLAVLKFIKLRTLRFGICVALLRV
jgi:hypothetical protein